MQLYNYFNSSTSYRVRIALALKQIDYRYLPVNIRNDEHRNADYLALNAAGGVPVLTDGDVTLHQSIAIIDYLDQTVPGLRLIPLEPLPRARALEMSLAIGCDIHPVNNMRVLRYLERTLKISGEQRAQWYAHWIDEGMEAVESLLVKYRHGTLCFGDTPTIAECCLIPQVTNAVRMGCDLSRFSLINQIFDRCMAMPAFAMSAPLLQSDCPA
jgi:maleylacetoacetate isomerase